MADPKKIKLIVSDFHLGRGKRLPNGTINTLEDFQWDEKFKEFLEYHTTGQYKNAEVELVFAGDILNLILTDYHGHYTVILTEAVSCEKLSGIFSGHKVFFDSLKKFLKNPKHTLTYVIGNHDQEMLWQSCKDMFEEEVGSPIQWRTTHYQIDGIHVEHGHQYEAANRIDPTRPFLTEGLPEPIINLPWGSLFAVQFLIKTKMQRQVIDKVRPFKQLIWWSLVHDTWWALLALSRLVLYFVSTRFTKNRYRQSSLKTTLKILREASVAPDLSDAAKRILRTPEIHTVIFGHSHVYKVIQVGSGKQYLNTGTWNEILSLDLDTYGWRTRLTFVRVDYRADESGEEQIVPLLRHWLGHFTPEEDAIGF